MEFSQIEAGPDTVFIHPVAAAQVDRAVLEKLRADGERGSGGDLPSGPASGGKPASGSGA